MYNIIIGGAGIIGLSTAYHLLLKDPSLKICILEKEQEISLHQTGRNSGVIHSGVYYKPGSLKALNCIKGYHMLLDFCRENNIEHKITGKLIIAANQTEEAALDKILERGTANGLTGIKILTKEQIKEHEPHATGTKALFIPQTGIVDYKKVSLVLLEKIISMGGEIITGEPITGIKLNGNADITTRTTELKAKMIILCAGLHTDKLAKLVNKKLDVRIIPFRGEYYKLKEDKRYLVKNLIYPVPDPAFPFLGVHFTRDINGNVHAGPNAVLAFKREGYKRSAFNFNDTLDTLTWKGFYKIAGRYWKTGLYEQYRSFSKKQFIRSLQKLIPEIAVEDIIPDNSGVRAQVCTKDGVLIDDFLINESGRMISVLNAPSPAATSSLAIGDTISSKAIKQLER